MDPEGVVTNTGLWDTHPMGQNQRLETHRTMTMLSQPQSKLTMGFHKAWTPVLYSSSFLPFLNNSSPYNSVFPLFSLQPLPFCSPGPLSHILSSKLDELPDSLFERGTALPFSCLEASICISPVSSGCGSPLLLCISVFLSVCSGTWSLSTPAGTQSHTLNLTLMQNHRQTRNPPSLPVLTFSLRQPLPPTLPLSNLLFISHLSDKSASVSWYPHALENNKDFCLRLNRIPCVFNHNLIFGLLILQFN